MVNCLIAAGHSKNDLQEDLERAVHFVQEGGDAGLVKMIELNFACKQLPNLDTVTRTDAMILVRLLGYIFGLISSDTGNWAEVGRTEIINDNLNPIFVKSVAVPYHFEKQQKVRKNLTKLRI